VGSPRDRLIVGRGTSALNAFLYLVSLGEYVPEGFLIAVVDDLHRTTAADWKRMTKTMVIFY